MGSTPFPSDALITFAGRWLRDLHDRQPSGVLSPAPHVDCSSTDLDAPTGDAHGGRVTSRSDLAPHRVSSGPFISDEVSGLADGDLSGPRTPLQDLALLALSVVSFTTRTGEADVPAPHPDRTRRLRLLTDSYGWDGDLLPVLSAVREGARQHAVWLRQSAARGYEPAIVRVAGGVAGDFDQAVEALDEDMLHPTTPGAEVR